MWWEKDGERRIFYAAGRELVSLNATDGKPIGSFGENGRLDLTPSGEHIGYIGVSVPGLVFADNIILGFSTNETTEAFPGSIRAFSAIDGELV